MNRKLTERIPHPVGINARIHEKISATLSSVSATAAATPAIASRNVMPWTNRNNNWKFTDIFWLKVKTYRGKKKYNDMTLRCKSLLISRAVENSSSSCRPWKVLKAPAAQAMRTHIPTKIYTVQHKHQTINR